MSEFNPAYKEVTGNYGDGLTYSYYLPIDKYYANRPVSEFRNPEPAYTEPLANPFIQRAYAARYDDPAVENLYNIMPKNMLNSIQDGVRNGLYGAVGGIRGYLEPYQEYLREDKR